MPKEPQTLRLLKSALEAGYRIDPETGDAFRPDGSAWPIFIDDKGYPSLQVTMRRAGGHLTIRLHKVVAYLVWGSRVFGGPNLHVRHLDGVKLNCRRGNLALGTAQDNNLDKAPAIRSDALRKRAISIGADRMSEIAKRSAETRGAVKSREFARIGAVPRRKLSTDEVNTIRENAKLPKGVKIPQRALARSMGVTQGTVCDVLAGRCYADTGQEAPEYRLGKD